MEPYTDLHIYNHNDDRNIMVRTFDEDIDSSEMVWHRDKKDREVKIIEGNGWKFQMDNELPSELKSGDVLNIPKETFHRVIKGSGKLVIEIRE